MVWQKDSKESDESTAPEQPDTDASAVFIEKLIKKEKEYNT